MYRQESLFNNISMNMPLADKMRPTKLEEYVGQEHLLGEGKMLRNAIESDNVNSMILWGPPGTGKTTLAKIIANTTQADFQFISAVSSSVKEIRTILSEAKMNRYRERKTILFIDEIHRFNKSQQDTLLPDVENGNIILIGATTENPSFEVNSALLSRVSVYVLHSLTLDNIIQIVKNALTSSSGYGDKKIEIEESALHFISDLANGDARSALKLLENIVGISFGNQKKITVDLVKECSQSSVLLYTKGGEEHFNIISALHKSMRNSDCDAALYWLARILEAGEDPLYVARRLIRFASEDIGMAAPMALQLAISAYEASHYIGMPECSVNLAQTVVYLSLSPKSNALYMAYESAKEDAKNTSAESVPLHLRNASTTLMKSLGYGEGYQYAHSYEQKITDMVCLPDKLCGKEYYKPTDQGVEKKYADRLDYIKNQKNKDSYFKKK